MSSKPKLRSFGDRLRQIALFEIGGLLLVTPPFAWASGVPITESLGLLAVLLATVAWGVDNTLSRGLAERDPSQVVMAKASLGAAATACLAVAWGEPLPVDADRKLSHFLV